MGQRAAVASSDLAALLSFANEVGHHLHRLPVAAVDVVGERGEHGTENRCSSLDLPDERPEVLVSAEVCSCGVDDELEALQWGALTLCGLPHFAEVFVGAAVEGIGDQVLAART